jgi:hypothetical protein
LSRYVTNFQESGAERGIREASSQVAVSRYPAMLLRYLEAYAWHSAGIVEAKSIY